VDAHLVKQMEFEQNAYLSDPMGRNWPGVIRAPNHVGIHTAVLQVHSRAPHNFIEQLDLPQDR
jgi:hypothetical protein